MYICEKCNSDHNGEYGSGRFCSQKCSRSYSTSSNRILINEKISRAIKGSGNQSTIKNCIYCGNEFIASWKRKDQKSCSMSCSMKSNWEDPEYKKNITEKTKIRCADIKERERMRDIGRKGGFGKKGTTEGGTRYDSNLEKICFEYLESKNIKFEAHKNIPNSSKISDVYLIDRNIWIELDGINREKRKNWLGKDYEYWLEKINIYKRESLDMRIAYNLEDLIRVIEKRSN
jgi:hypothetical protein